MFNYMNFFMIQLNISFICHVFFNFFIVLEGILFLYLITSWLPFPSKIKHTMLMIVEPMFQPIRYLLRHSIFNTPSADLTPMIVFVVLTFLEKFLYVMI